MSSTHRDHTAPGTPYSMELLIRTEAVYAFDGTPGSTISDRMLAVVAERDRYRQALEVAHKQLEAALRVTPVHYGPALNAESIIRHALTGGGPSE